MKRLIILLITLTTLVGLYAQNSKSVLESTKLIADKVMRETSFEYELKVLGSNGGWSSFSVPQIVENEQVIAYAVMESEKEAKTRIGISFKGNISIYMNGEEIFRGRSDSLELSEYTYNRYNIQEIVPVNIHKGENEIVIHCRSGTGATKIMLLAVNELDAEETYISIVPLISDPSNSEWLISGPHPISNLEETLSGPKANSSRFNLNTFNDWAVPSQPIIRELIISESNSFLRDSYADWHYANGGTMLGILNLYLMSDEEKYLDFVNRYSDNITDNRDYFHWQYLNQHALRGSLHKLIRKTMLDDTGGPVLPFAQLKLIQPEKDLNNLLEEMLDYVLNQQARLPDGTLCRPEPEPNTIWADDLFMTVPFLCRMARIKGDNTLYDEAAMQIILFNKYLLNSKTGLYFHGWYSDREQSTSVQWGRANGWVTWAMSEALLLIPEDHQDYKKILNIFRDHIEAIAEFQDANGMWHQVLDHPETYEETSCTAMFSLSLARGVRNEWLKEEYREDALEGWKAVANKIAEDGTVEGICRGTEIGETIEFYNARKTFDHDPRGLGAMINAGTEIYFLLQSSGDSGSD